MNTRCVMLCGGVGGAKLALGMSQLMAGPELAVVANTGDDFRHLGLAICPDLDTLMYTLAGQVNPETGWGRADESWQCLGALEALGAETWFQLGDRDLATHLLRSEILSRGERLTTVTRLLCDALGVTTRLLPVSDDEVATQVQTEDGLLAFQEYFVRLRCEPRVNSIHFHGAPAARLTAEVRAALADPALELILIAPSNPYLSIDPMLAVPGLRDALTSAPVPVLAVSPIVGGRALKGPAAKIMQELGRRVSAAEVASHYQPCIDGFILDTIDEASQLEITALGLQVHCCNTLMNNLDDRRALAREALLFAERCRATEAPGP